MFCLLLGGADQVIWKLLTVMMKSCLGGREIIARPEEMARLLGWRAEGILSNVIRDSGLFISHESPA